MSGQSAYVAHVKVERVTKQPSSGNQPPKRDIVETLNLTIKAASLSTLKEKIAAHTSLLDEEDLS